MRESTSTSVPMPVDSDKPDLPEQSVPDQWRAGEVGVRGDGNVCRGLRLGQHRCQR